MGDGLPDVVYPVKPGDKNEELRFSLRSLANLPHGTVWLVGHKPKWVTGVEHIPGNRGGDKWRNVFDNIRTACKVDAVAEQVVVMNDDFYVMEPVDRAPCWYRGRLDAHIARTASNSTWQRSLQRTEEWLHGQYIRAPLSYELHVPFPCVKDRMAMVLDEADRKGVPPQWRTLYGNWWKVDAVQAPDCKITRRRVDLPDSPFLSSNDGAFAGGEIGRHVRATFPDPSPYEAA